jgi:C1A family cysteine protease
MPNKVVFKQKKKFKYIAKNIGRIFCHKDIITNKNRTESDFKKLMKWKPSPNINNFTQYHFSDLMKEEEADLAPTIDLRTLYRMPQIYDQGSLGSCTANSLAFLYAFTTIKQLNKTLISPSRLFIYYNERKIEGTINFDNGAVLSDGFRSLSSVGTCSESQWPYVQTQFAKAPPTACYTSAKLNRALSYTTLGQSLQNFKMSIVQNMPFIIGFYVWSNFLSASNSDNGLMPMPTSNDSIIGGHAVVAVGYDDTILMPNNEYGAFLIRNSWGTNWGLNGYFYMPYAFITNTTIHSEFWILKTVTNPISTSAKKPTPAKKIIIKK